MQINISILRFASSCSILDILGDRERDGVGEWAEIPAGNFGRKFLPDISVGNFGRKFQPEISAENLGRKIRPEISAGNFCWKLRPEMSARNFGRALSFTLGF